MPAQPNTIENALRAEDEVMHSKYITIREAVKPFLTWSPPTDQEALPRQYYTDHGVKHSERVIEKLNQFWKCNEMELNPYEMFILLSCSWCHDLGMFMERPTGEDFEITRQLHHIRSAEAIETLSSCLGFTSFELPIIKEISMAHRKVPLSSLATEKIIGGSVIRVRLLAALLRIADACDIDHRRAPEAIFHCYEQMIPPISKNHWRRHFPVSGVYYKRERSSIIVSVQFSKDLVEFIEQQTMVYLIRKKLIEEIKSVEDVFGPPHDVRIHHVEIQDFTSGGIIDVSSFDVSNSWVLIGIDINGKRGRFLTELSNVLNAHRGRSVVVLDVHSSLGHVRLKLPVKIKISDKFESLLKALNGHLVYFKIIQLKRGKEEIITGEIIS